MFYLNNVCSLCLAHNKIFTSRSCINSSAEEMLQRIIPEFVQRTSGIPRKLCDKCLGSLTAVFEFRQQCLANINIFDEYVSKLQLGNGSYKYLSVNITDIKLDMKKEIDRAIISDEDTCLILSDFHNNVLQINDINKEHSYNKALDGEQDENNRKNDVVLKIKNEIREEVLLNEEQCLSEDDFRNNILNINDISREHSYNKDPNKEQDENIRKSNVIEIKKEISEEIMLNEDNCFVEDDVHTNFLQINMKQENSFNRELNEEKEENDQDSAKTLTASGSGTEQTNEPPSQEVDCDERLKCTKCGEESSNRMGDIDSPKCQKCQPIISQNESKKVHSAKKSYSCNTCQKSFRAISILKTHERVHTNERPFSCNLCVKEFKHAGTLSRHRLHVHFKETFVCNICQKGFPQGKFVRIHNPSHRDKSSFKCGFCQQLFAKFFQLKKHEAVHTGIKCTICENRYSGKHHLL